VGLIYYKIKSRKKKITINKMNNPLQSVAFNPEQFRSETTKEDSYKISKRLVAAIDQYRTSKEWATLYCLCKVILDLSDMFSKDVVDRAKLLKNALHEQHINMDKINKITVKSVGVL
jgi:hypothetical protein